MKPLFKAVILSAILTYTSTAEAQLFKKLGEKVTKAVERTVERKAEEKAEHTTENAIDSLLTPKERRKKARKNKSTNGNGMDGIMNDILNTKDIHTEDRYLFPITATMQVTSHKGKKRVDKMTQSYGGDAIYVVVEGTPAPIITDFKNEAAILLNDKEKTAQIVSLSWLKKMGQMSEIEPRDDDENVRVTKTGNTKTMHGYTCYEYEIIHDKTKMLAWLAPDVNFSYSDYLQSVSKMFGNQISSVPQDKGYVMQMDIYEDNKPLSSMEITAISETPIVINLSNYSINKAF